jgi:hypothetical protein
MARLGEWVFMTTCLGDSSTTLGTAVERFPSLLWTGALWSFDATRRRATNHSDDSANHYCSHLKAFQNVYLRPREAIAPVNRSDFKKAVLTIVETFRETAHLIALPIIIVCLIVVLAVPCFRYE